MNESRLYRNSSDSFIAGICGGLGNHLNIDPILFRILFVLAFILGGSGLLIYIILWIVIPEKPATPFGESQFKSKPMNEETMNHQQNPTRETKKENRNDGNLWGGVILIALGAMFLIDRFVPRIHFGDLWPIILIVVGGILITKAYQQNKS